MHTFKSRIYISRSEIALGAWSGTRTMTVRPLVYAILSLLELILVDSPRVVAGLQGYSWTFLKDMATISVYFLARYRCSQPRPGCQSMSVQVQCVCGRSVDDPKLREATGMPDRSPPLGRYRTQVVDRRSGICMSLSRVGVRGRLCCWRLLDGPQHRVGHRRLRFPDRSALTHSCECLLPLTERWRG